MAGSRGPRKPAVSAILEGQWSIFPTDPSPTATPFPADHALTRCITQAISPVGLSAGNWLYALADDPIRPWSTLVRATWLKAKVAHATGNATPEVLDAIRTDGLRALAAITDETQRRTGSPLDQYINGRLATVIRPPSNGRRQLRRALTDANTTD